MTVKQMRQALVGRKIVAFRANAFRDGRALPNTPDFQGGFLEPPPDRGSFTYDPVLILDDGTELSFHVHETEHGEYGIDPTIRKGRGG